MEIKHFGNAQGKSVMLLHGNLMCWRQFEDLIPLLEKDYSVYAVSFDGFDGSGSMTYTTAQAQVDKLEDYICADLGGHLTAAAYGAKVRPSNERRYSRCLNASQTASTLPAHALAQMSPLLHALLASSPPTAPIPPSCLLWTLLSQCPFLLPLYELLPYPYA